MKPDGDLPVRRSWLPWVLVGLLAVTVWITVLTTPYLANALGLGPTGAYLDLRGILAANEAKGLGMDPYALNPLDPYGRPFLYSTWWLWQGLTRADTGWLGSLLVAGTLAAGGLMWRPRDRREGWVAALVLLSPAWLLAIFRANNDLVIFVLLALAICALQRSSRVGRAVGAMLVGVMAVLKYYPAAAVVGLFRASGRREVLVFFAIFAGVIALGWPSLAPAITAIRNYGSLTNAMGLQAFGLKALGESLAPYASVAIAWLAGLVALAVGFRLATERELTTPRSAESEDRRMAAAVGGAVLIGCFAIGTSYNYKLIFVWPLLPWLMRDASATLGTKKTWAIVALVVFVCWAGGVVTAIMNTLGPGWSRENRAHLLTFAHAFVVVIQLACWSLVGVWLRLTLDWSRQQLARLATAP